MANANTIFAARALAQANPLTNAGIFLRSDLSAVASKVAGIYFPPTIPGTLNNAMTLRFNVKAWGTAITSVTSNFQAILYYGVSTTAASNTAMITLTNRSYVSTSGQWQINGDFLWDGRTQKIQGVTEGSSSNLTTLETLALITPVTGVDMTLSNLGMCVGALFGTTGAGNIAYMDGFRMDLI